MAGDRVFAGQQVSPHRDARDLEAAGVIGGGIADRADGDLGGSDRGNQVSFDKTAAQGARCGELDLERAGLARGHSGARPSINGGRPAGELSQGRILSLEQVIELDDPVRISLALIAVIWVGPLSNCDGCVGRRRTVGLED